MYRGSTYPLSRETSMEVIYRADTRKCEVHLQQDVVRMIYSSRLVDGIDLFQVSDQEEQLVTSVHVADVGATGQTYYYEEALRVRKTVPTVGVLCTAAPF